MEVLQFIKRTKMKQKFTVYCITKITEEAEIEAESLEEAISLAEQNPSDYDWSECGELENEYEGE